MELLELVAKVITVISKGVAVVDAIVKIINEGGIELEQLCNSDKK
ncbi:hypothetical protein [Clostridium tagluense]|nr:hypothetical protein [Clostridium tagluense]